MKNMKIILIMLIMINTYSSELRMLQGGSDDGTLLVRPGTYSKIGNEILLKTRSRNVVIKNQDVLEKYFEINNFIEVEYSDTKEFNDAYTKDDVINSLDTDIIKPYVKQDF